MKTSGEPMDFPLGEEENFKEHWTSVRVLRGHLQVSLVVHFAHILYEEKDTRLRLCVIKKELVLTA